MWVFDSITFFLPPFLSFFWKKNCRGLLFKLKAPITLTDIDSWLRTSLRPSLVRSRQGHHGLERKWSWSVVYIWPGCGITIPPKTWHGSDLPCSSSGWRWIRILLQATTGNPIQCSKLLRGVRQCRCDDECWWESTLFIPGVYIYGQQMNGIVLYIWC